MATVSELSWVTDGTFDAPQPGQHESLSQQLTNFLEALLEALPEALRETFSQNFAHGQAARHSFEWKFFEKPFPRPWKPFEKAFRRSWRCTGNHSAALRPLIAPTLVAWSKSCSILRWPFNSPNHNPTYNTCTDTHTHM